MADLGDVIANRYRLDELIGRGGMAAVYRAWDVPLARPVAVKLLRPEILADPDLAFRFRREAHAATVLRHPNVVACLDTGREGDQPYLVMDLVDGEDLAARLRRDGALPPAEATRIAIDVARGLAVAHARGIVHRDVKPGNILLGTDGVARVTDFGIARLAAEAEATIPGTTLGSVHYFSPEQARGATTTAASDVYSLGLVLFEMLTGTRPFSGSSPAEIALARVDAPAPSPVAVNPSLPPALDAVVRRALAPDPADRFPNGGAIAAELEALTRPAPMATGRRTDGLRVAPMAVARRTGSGIVPLAAVVAIILALVGGLSLVQLIGGDGGVVALEPSPTPRDPVVPRVTPDLGAPSATPAPTPAPTRRPDGTLDLCTTTRGAACALEPDVYAPSLFVPEVVFETGEGWSTVLHAEDLLVLARAEGYLAIASNGTIFDEGELVETRRTARALARATADNGDLDIVDEGRLTIDGHDGTWLDVDADDDERVEVFGTTDDVYFAEVGTVTRFAFIDVGDTPVIVVIEPVEGFGLEDILDAADGTLRSLAFR